MEAKLIDLNDWILSGGGAQGDSYFSKTDDSVMLKLFSGTLPRQDIEHEVELTHNIALAGISCPAVYDFVTDGKRYGITFQRIQHKKSFARAVADDPSLTREFAGRLARMGRELHATKADTSRFRSMKVILGELLLESTSLSGDDKALYGRFLSEVPEVDTYLHGDFHFGNVITDGQKDYYIDLGFFSWGHPFFDISMLYFVSMNNNEERTQDMYHMPCSQTVAFWHDFKKEYFGAELPSDEEIARILAPYMLLRTLVFEHDLGPSSELDGIRAALMRGLR